MVQTLYLYLYFVWLGYHVNVISQRANAIKVVLIYNLYHNWQLIVEGMAQWLRRWTHDRKVVGSIPGPDSVCVLEQDTLYHIVPVHSAENEYQQNLGVNLASYPGGVLHSQLLNAAETGISSGLMHLKARDRL